MRYSREHGVYLEDGLDSTELNERYGQTYDACLRFLQSLCRSDHNSQSEECNINETQADNEPQTRRQRSRRPKDNRIGSDQPYLVPSDHITILKLGSSDMIGVFVSRFWVQRLDEDRNFFMILTMDGQGVVSCSSISTIGAAVFVKDNSSASEAARHQRKCRTTGKLGDGTRYYMYRLLLYADDFTQRSSLFPKGSVGGLYMNPSSFHTRSRRSQSTIRTVSLTPPGVSTNSVMEFILEDLVQGSIEGIDCVDAFGQHVRVFFDVMGFIGDYPASSGVVDLKGHTANAPCTVCGFVCNKGSDVSTYAYTTSVTSCNTAYRRSQKRMESIREAGLPEYHHKCLGMSVLDPDTFLDSGSCPLLHFASKFNKHLIQRHVSVRALPFDVFDKDGYTLNVVAPDHLITGLFKGVLLVVFIQLPDDDSRYKVQTILKASLAEFGFQSQSMLYKSKKKKLVPGLSMSVLYAILTVLPSTLHALNLLDDLPSKRILINLNKFFILAFWWPTLAHDGEEAWNFVHGERMGRFHTALQLLACNFVKAVDKFNATCPSLASYVDRPNTHRLLELVFHTIPAFNHLAYICELVFESAHQPLKFFLSRNHTLNSHIYSVQLNLAKDWLIRVWSTWRMYTDEQEETNLKTTALLGLLRLFGGKEADDIDWTSPVNLEHLHDIREHIHGLMAGTVERRLNKWYSDTRTTFNSTPSWVLHQPPKAHSFSQSQGDFFQGLISEVSRLCLLKQTDLNICNKALLSRGFGSLTKGSHERIELGDIIQVLIRSGFSHTRFPSAYMASNGLPTFFVVGGFIKSRSGIQWAIVKQCTLLSPSTLAQLPGKGDSFFTEVSTPNFYDDGNQPWYCFQMFNQLRKVGYIHNCSANGLCEFSDNTQRVHHSTTTLGEGRFYIISKRMGYPPRRS